MKKNALKTNHSKEAAKKAGTKKPDPVDVYVGSRIRMRRMMLGLSQQTVAGSLGVSFQQLQKYEKGTNRVGASRLQHLATILKVTVSFFFDELPDQNSSTLSEDTAIKFLLSNEGMELNRAFVDIPDPKIRKKVVALVQSLSEAEVAAGS